MPAQFGSSPHHRAEIICSDKTGTLTTNATWKKLPAFVNNSAFADDFFKKLCHGFSTAKLLKLHSWSQCKSWLLSPGPVRKCAARNWFCQPQVREWDWLKMTIFWSCLQCKASKHVLLRPMYCDFTWFHHDVWGCSHCNPQFQAVLRQPFGGIHRWGAHLRTPWGCKWPLLQRWSLKVGRAKREATWTRLRHVESWYWVHLFGIYW